jgi:hypothetical protein
VMYLFNSQILLCRGGSRIRVASACGFRKRRLLLLGGLSIGDFVRLQAETWDTGKEVEMIYAK